MSARPTYFKSIWSLGCQLLFSFSGIAVAQEKSFEFVVPADTQTYVEEFPEIYLETLAL